MEGGAKQAHKYVREPTVLSEDSYLQDGTWHHLPQCCAEARDRKWTKQWAALPEFSVQSAKLAFNELRSLAKLEFSSRDAIQPDELKRVRKFLRKGTAAGSCSMPLVTRKTCLVKDGDIWRMF